MMIQLVDDRTRRLRKLLTVIAISIVFHLMNIEMILSDYTSGFKSMVVKVAVRTGELTPAELKLMKLQEGNIFSAENWMFVCDKDDFNFRPVLDKIEIRQLTDSERRIKILCLVDTNQAYHDTRAKAIMATWGSRCDKLVFASNHSNESIGAIKPPNLSEGSPTDDLWNKHRETLRFVWDHYKDDYDWFFKANDETYVIIDNLIAFLMSPEIQAQHNRGASLHIGNPTSVWIDGPQNRRDEHRKANLTLPVQGLERPNGTLIFNAGDAGYVINKPFLANMIQWIDRPECTTKLDYPLLGDDAMVSVCSSFFGAFPYNKTRDALGRERFHRASPSALYTMTPKDHLYQLYEIGKRLTGGDAYR